VSYTELHQRLLEHYAGPSLVVDDRYDIVHLSDRAGQFLQLGPGEPSLNLLRVAPDGLRGELESALDDAIGEMRTVERKGLPARRGTQPLRIDVTVHPVRDELSGRTFALIIFDEASAAELAGEELEGDATLASSRPTTALEALRRKVDEATRTSDDLQNFITATEIASLLVDRQMRLVRYTPFAREIFNLIPADIGRPLLDITHRLEGVDFEREIARVFESLHLAELEARASDGRWYIVRILPYGTTEDRIRGAVLTFIDITQRKSAELAVLRSEAWAKIVIDSVHDYAIMTLDPSGAIETWNDGGRRIFGYAQDEVAGRHFAMLFLPEDRAAGVPQTELADARRTGRGQDDRWMVRKDGSRFFASGMTAPLMVSHNDGFVKLLRDATEQHQAAQRSDEALSVERGTRRAAEEASQLKDDFLAMLSHELRNPLALMLMQSEILLRAPESAQAPKLRQAAQVIYEMVRAQSQLVEDMLDMSRARTGRLAIEPQLLPLTFLIAGSIGALRNEAEQKAITLDVKIDEAPLIVAADPLRVRQIAWNLLSNAIKFTPRGGTIRVRLMREHGAARLDIEDTGQGMPPEVAMNVFDWSRRVETAPAAREGGLGIGLALVRQLVDLHGGRVEAHSEGVGKGARFTVWLPLEANGAEEARPAPAALHERRPLEGMRILVVDDSQANGDALRELLQLMGAVAAVESSGAAALSRLEVDRFDVVISDIAMPGMDGFEFLEILRTSKGNSRTRAIALSGYGSPKDVERAKRSGFDAHITKPADVEKLVATLRAVAGKPPLEQ
jgi:two-component system CheB/CheR fusion protein